MDAVQHRVDFNRLKIHHIVEVSPGTTTLVREFRNIIVIIAAAYLLTTVVTESSKSWNRSHNTETTSPPS